MPRYVGLDVHKQFIEACFIDEQGNQLHRCRFAITRESIQSFTTKCLQPSDQVVMEATTKMCAHRAALTADQTRIKNRIQGLLAQRLIPVPLRVLFNGSGRNWLSNLELATQDRARIDSYLRVLDQIESEETYLQKASTQLSYDKEQIRLLMTLPGLGATGAQAFYAALGDWRRFKDGAHAPSYLGLTHSSGGID